jgi:hypothetical protein
LELQIKNKTIAYAHLIKSQDWDEIPSPISSLFFNAAPGYWFWTAENNHRNGKG